MQTRLFLGKRTIFVLLGPVILSILSLILVTSLSGCGKKGPLYLPDDTTGTTQNSTTQPSKEKFNNTL